MIPLFRSSRHKLIGGVCGGIAEWLGLPPWSIRVTAVVTLFAWGLTGTLYLLAWATLPIDGH
ncbi:PspC domain protein [Peptococcaceae bacterium CEB3]|nr:PspC domain protein [Peptococcaceae bacterium CEB3]